MRHKILVVDDNADIVSMFVMLLEHGGYEAASAFDGREAIQKVSEFQPDVVLCDVGLPDMDGYEVARAIRQDSRNAETVLIAITGWSTDEDKQLSREAGFNHHLTKPVGWGDLSALLSSITQ